MLSVSYGSAKTRTEFWSEKRSGNSEIDQRNNALLQYSCWNAITVWECELKKNTFEDTIKLLKQKIKGSAKNHAE